MNNIQYVHDLIQRNAELNPNKLAIRFYDCFGVDKQLSVSNLELLRLCLNARDHLVKIGIKQDDKVVLALPTGPEWVASFFGLLMIGAIPVPLAPDLDLTKFIERYKFISQDCQSNAIIIPDLFKNQFQAAYQDIIACSLSFDCLIRDRGELENNIDPIEPKLAFIQYTSGSTSEPKGVMLSHSNLMANISSISNALELDGDIDVATSWLPLYHDMGLIGMLLTALYGQVSLHLMDTLSFIKSPIKWLRTISDSKSTITTAPNFAFSLCNKRARKFDGDLKTLRVLMNGAEPIQYGDLETFHQNFKEHGLRFEALSPVYGLAESSLAVTFSIKGNPKFDHVDQDQFAKGNIVHTSNAENALKIVSVGKPIDTQSVKIECNQETESPENVIGEILVKGPSVMEGYLNRSSPIESGWLRTGDLGYIHNGELYVTGRKKDLIIINGKNYYPQDIERLIETVEGVRNGRSAVFEHTVDSKNGLTVLFEADGTDPDISVKIKRLIYQELTLPIHDVVRLDRGALPITTSGKVRRQPAKLAYFKQSQGGHNA